MDTLKKPLNETQMKEIEFYCKNEMKELKRIVDPILRKNHVPRMNHDDVYGIALETLYRCALIYNGNKAQFKTLLIGSIQRKFSSYQRDCVTDRRKNVLKKERVILPNGKVQIKKIVEQDASFEWEDENGNTLKDTFPAKYSLENEIICKFEGIFTDEKVISYLEKLPKMEKNVAILLGEGYDNNEIMEELHISKGELTDCLNGMRQYDKVCVLF